MFAGVAQSVEHLICNQRVGGSNPFASSRVEAVCGREAERREAGSTQPKSRAVCARELKKRFFRQAADSAVAAQQVFPRHSIRIVSRRAVIFAVVFCATLVSLFGEIEAFSGRERSGSPLPKS